MEKVDILKYGLIGAVVIWCVPIFVKSLVWMRYGLAVPLLFVSVVYFVAYDQINNIISKKGFSFKKKTYSEEDWVDVEKQHKKQLRELEMKAELERKKADIEKIKAEKNSFKQHMFGSSDKDKKDGKFPDVLGNLSGVMTDGSSKKKQDKHDKDLRELF